MTDETAPSPHNRLGHSRIFTPEVIDDIHVKSELGRYRMRGFSMFKKIPHWDELMFLPGHADAVRDRGLPREVRRRARCSARASRRSRSSSTSRSTSPG